MCREIASCKIMQKCTPICKVSLPTGQKESYIILFLVLDLWWAAVTTDCKQTFIAYNIYKLFLHISVLLIQCLNFFYIKPFPIVITYHYTAHQSSTGNIWAIRWKWCEIIYNAKIVHLHMVIILCWIQKSLYFALMIYIGTCITWAHPKKPNVEQYISYTLYFV